MTDHEPEATIVNAVVDPWGGPAVMETERLILRPYRHEDVGLYAAISSDPEVMRYLGGPRDPADTEEQMAGSNDDLRRTGAGMVAVERRDDGQFLGAVGLSVVPWYPDDLQLGWRLAPPHWGHGYATEAARAWLAHGFEVLGWDRLTAMADVPNRRSLAVMERLGMSRLHEVDLTEGGERFRVAVYELRVATWTARPTSRRIISRPGAR